MAWKWPLKGPNSRRWRYYQPWVAHGFRGSPCPSLTIYKISSHLFFYLSKNLLLATELGLKDLLVVSIVMKMLLGNWVKTIDNSCWWPMQLICSQYELAIQAPIFIVSWLWQLIISPKKIGNNANLRKGCNPRV